jgi:hypothetical protein
LIANSLNSLAKLISRSSPGVVESIARLAAVHHGHGAPRSMWLALATRGGLTRPLEFQVDFESMFGLRGFS